MNWAIVYFVIMYVLPFPIASLYGFLKGANRYLTVSPLLMVSVQLIGLYWMFSLYGHTYEFSGFIRYLVCCFVAMVIGTVGLYYGVLKRTYHYGGEMGMNVWRCFVYCFCLLVFPIVTACLWCYAIRSVPTPTEKVAKKRPELGKRPSWRDVAEEREKEKEGGG